MPSHHTGPSQRQEKINQALQRLVSEFINENSGGQSLITVSYCDVAPDLSKADVYVTVLPDNQEKPALAFLGRQVRDMFDFVKNKSVLRRTPRLHFKIDQGAKNRLRVLELSREIAEE